MVRALLGIVKGGLVGGAVGFGAWKLGFGGGAPAYLVYAVVGFLVGVVCGKPVWRQETLVTPVLKGIVGALIGAGLYWVAGKALGGVPAPFAEQLGAKGATLPSVPVILGPLVGVIYGIFVEIDDGGKDAAAAPKPAV